MPTLNEVLEARESHQMAQTESDRAKARYESVLDQYLIGQRDRNNKLKALLAEVHEEDEEPAADVDHEAADPFPNPAIDEKYERIGGRIGGQEYQ